MYHPLRPNPYYFYNNLIFTRSSSAISFTATALTFSKLTHKETKNYTNLRYKRSIHIAAILLTSKHSCRATPVNYSGLPSAIAALSTYGRVSSVKLKSVGSTSMDSHEVFRDGEGESDEVLQSLWSEAIEGMINVPGMDEDAYENNPDGGKSKVLYLCPSSGSNSNNDHGIRKDFVWPEPFRNGRRVFCLTGHNPMGQTVSKDLNQKANEELLERIMKGDFVTDDEVNITAKYIYWHSFGFHMVEGWREDGFALSFNENEVAVGRNAVLNLARDFNQGAIYEFKVDEKSGRLFRSVVWCDEKKREIEGDDDFTEMVALLKAPDSDLARERE